jgi:hypothetical protein
VTHHNTSYLGVGDRNHENHTLRLAQAKVSKITSQPILGHGGMHMWEA